MAKSITITIDMSGRNMDSHGAVESTPNISINAHGLNTEAESLLLGNIYSALVHVINPQPVTA